MNFDHTWIEIRIEFRRIFITHGSKFGSNVELFGTKSGSTFRSKFEQLDQIWSNFGPRSIKNRSEIGPWTLLRHPRAPKERSGTTWSVPGALQECPESVPEAFVEHEVKQFGGIVIGTNLKTKIWIALWASWTTNDTNFCYIFEQVLLIVWSLVDQIQECKNWSKFERFSSCFKHKSQSCDMLKVPRLSTKTRVRQFAQQVDICDQKSIQCLRKMCYFR